MDRVLSCTALTEFPEPLSQVAVRVVLGYAEGQAGPRARAVVAPADVDDARPQQTEAAPGRRTVVECRRRVPRQTLQT